jgi:hypothetical protein
MAENGGAGNRFGGLQPVDIRGIGDDGAGSGLHRVGTAIGAGVSEGCRSLRIGGGRSAGGGLGPATWKLTDTPEMGGPLVSFRVANKVCVVPMTLGRRCCGVSVSMVPVTRAVSSVTVAAADFVGSTWLRTVTVTVC